MLTAAGCCVQQLRRAAVFVWHAGQQSDYTRRRLFEARPDDAEWDRHRWDMVQAADNPAALPGVIMFLAKVLAAKVG